MKHLNKYLSLALALVLCLSLAACGESNEDYGDDGSDYNLYGVPDSFEGLVKDSEQMANLYIYGGAWTGEDGGTLIVANNDEGDEVRFALYDIDEELTASGFIQFVPDYDYDYFYNEHDGVAYELLSAEEHEEYSKNLSYPVYIVTYTAGENEDTREWTVFVMDTDICTYLYGFCAPPDAAADMGETYQNIFSQLYLSDEE